VNEGDLTAVVFNILHQFLNRSILGQGQKEKAFGLGCESRWFDNVWCNRFYKQ